MERNDEHYFFVGCEALWSRSKVFQVVFLSRDEVESDRRWLTFLGYLMLPSSGQKCRFTLVTWRGRQCVAFLLTYYS